MQKFWNNYYYKKNCEFKDKYSKYLIIWLYLTICKFNIRKERRIINIYLAYVKVPSIKFENPYLYYTFSVKYIRFLCIGFVQYFLHIYNVNILF